MWTPRRILLTLLGLLAFAASYFGYARALGTYDGLPPLPDHLQKKGPSTNRGPAPKGTDIDRKLEMAFGANCPELRYPIKLAMKGRRIIVAAYKFEIIKTGPRTGWVEFSPLSIASFGEKRGADGIPEINTLYADQAFLKFDKPIRAMSDFDGREIVAAELHANPEAELSDARKGRIRAANNRRTLDLNDDIEMVTPGPVYYDDQPKKGQPHIYTFTAVHVTDHLNTGLPRPDRTTPREPTVTGVGLRVFLTPDDDKKKKDPPKKDEPRLPIPRKDTKGGLNGVELVEFDHNVEMNLWTDANASFVAPGGGKDPKKDDPKKVEPKKDAKKDPAQDEKRLLTIKTNGPFRYDLIKELAHFEKPAVPKPLIIEQVTVTRVGRTTGQDSLVCEYLDVQFRRKKPPAPPKDALPKEALPPKKDGTSAGDGDLEIKSIRAWGETVVITSDSDKLHATGSELTHDADAHMTILKGDGAQGVQAVKDGNLLRGSELHLFGDGKEISQAHVLGAGSVGMGELDPKTGQFFKQAFWYDRMVFARQSAGKDKPPIDVITFLGKDGQRARFRDTTGGQLQEIEADQLKLDLDPAAPKEAKKDPKDPKKEPKKEPAKKADGSKGETHKSDATAAAKPKRLQAIGNVRSTSPEVIIKHSNYLDVDFRDVAELTKPPVDPKTDPKAKDPKSKDPKAPPTAAPGKDPAVAKPDPKVGPTPKKDEPKEEPREKKPMIVTARTIKCLVNRDPQGRNEMDQVHALGEVFVHQDPATKDELGTDIRGDKVDMQAYKGGNLLTVIGTPKTDTTPESWGVVKLDKLTMFGFDIVIDQRDNTSAIKGPGSMEIVSRTDMEGKKLEKPTTMTIYWKHKMDFLGAEKLIYYHGNVQGYQDLSQLKCEWMQILLDRPVYLNQALKPKAPPKKLQPGEKKEDDNPNIDTVMCFHAPRDQDVPKPRTAQPVQVIQEEMEGKKLIRSQSVQGPDVTTVNTPIEGQKARKDMTVTATDTMPGTVRIWQRGPKDALAEKPPADDLGPKGKGPTSKKDAIAKKDVPPKKKGEMAADEEMQLTVVQFGGKMIANDFRKRAKFFTNVRVLHMPTDDPRAPVDLREGEIPKGAVYMEARDTLDVFSMVQKEKDPKTGKDVDVAYQEMIGIGNVRVRKQGEFFGDADKVTYSELKGTLTFHGTKKNPAIVNQVQGQGIKDKTMEAETIIYFVKTKTFETINATRVTQ